MNLIDNDILDENKRNLFKSSEGSQEPSLYDSATDISAKPDYSLLDTITGAAGVFEKARLAGFTPDEAGATAYAASGIAEADSELSWEEAGLLGKAGQLPMRFGSGVIATGAAVAKGTIDLTKDIATNPEVALQAPADIAMASLMNGTDWAKDVMLYGVEKATDAAGWVFNSSALSNFDPYSYYKSNKEFYDKHHYSGREMSESLTGLVSEATGGAINPDLAYAKHEGFYDAAGDFINAIGIYSRASKLIDRKSFLGKAAGKMGLPEKWTNRIFADTEMASLQANELRRTVAQLTKNGINPSAVMNVAKEAKKSAKAIAPTAIKETVAGELGLWGSHYAHDELYPEERTWKQDLAFNIGLPALLGVGLPMAVAANKTRQLFNRGADKAAINRNSLMEEMLLRNGMDAQVLENQKKQFGGVLADYGLIGNQAADIAVETNYYVKNLKAMKEQSLSSLEKVGFGNSSATLNDVKRAWDADILAAETKNKQALDELIKDTPLKDDKEFVRNVLVNAQDNWSNVLQGTYKVSIAPRTQVELEEKFGEMASKLAKLEKQAKSTNPRLKPENRLKRIEALEKAKAEGYQILTEDGQVIPSSEFHMPWSDSPRNLESIQSYQKPVMTNGERATSFKVKVQDDSIVKDDVFDLSSGVDGSVMIKRGDTSERPLSYTDTAAWNPSWQLLSKQLKWAMKGERDQAGRLVTNFEKLGNKLTNKIPVNLNTVNHVQAAYLEQLAKNFGDSQMTKVFAFNDKVLGSLRKQLASSELPQPELSDVFHELRIRATQDFLHMREVDKTSKAALWQFPKFTDESLFTEMTGLKLNKQVLNDVGSLETAARYSNDVGLFSYKPQRYAIQETTSLGALTDQINNDIFNRLAATKQHRTSTLMNSKGTLVGDIARTIAEKPQFKNGYVSNPNGIAFGSDVGGKLGHYIMTQEMRTEGNIGLNASQALSNELSLYLDKQISSYMAPLTERVQKFIKKKESVDDFNKFLHQTQSGWNMADNKPVALPNGRFGFLLDNEKMAVNEKIANRQTMISNGRFTYDQKALEYYDKDLDEYFTLLPDPISGQPLTVDAEVADLLYEAHNLNKKIWQGNQDINASIGRQGTRFRNYWAPAEDLSTGEVRIIGHEDGNRFIADMYVRGNTVKQAEDGAKLEMAIAGWDKKREYSIRTPKEEGMTKELIREDVNATGFDFVNYGDSWLQEMSSLTSDGTRTSKGNIIYTGEDNVRRWLESVNHVLQVQGRRTRMAMFSDEINSAMALRSVRKEGEAGYNELSDYIANLSGSRWKRDDARSKVYSAFDKLVEQGAQAFNDWRNLDKYTRAEEAARIENGQLRSTSRLFESGEEVKRLYNFRGELADQAQEAMRLVGVTKSLHSKEIMGQLNKVATWGLLMAGNFGYAAMNLVSLPAMMPMMLKSLRKLPGEDARMAQARLGAWAKVDKNGNVYPDFVGGATETFNYYMHNKAEFKQLMADAEEAGILSTKATLLGETFVDPVGSVLSKGGRKLADWVSKVGVKSEEMSRVIPFATVYRMGRRAGLGHAESMAMARKQSDFVVGSYVSSNRPALLQDSLGSLNGLFMTWTHNYAQDYVKLALTGQKAAIATGLATQAFMFGPTSLPGFDQLADLFIPLDSGRDLYSALRDSGFSDTQARAWIYGAPSALTGLDFSSKGSIDPKIPGLATPPVISLAGNLWDMTSDAIDALANTTNTNGRMLLEMMQNYLPFTAAKSSLTIGMGYKTDRAGRLVADKDSIGNLEWYAANILSMRTLDETMNRRAMQRNNNYIAHQNEVKGWVRRDMASGFRSGRPAMDVIHDGVINWINAGGDPAQLKNLVKTAAMKAFSPTIAQQAKSATNKKWQTPSDQAMAKTLRYLAIAGSDGELDVNDVW